MSRKRNQADYDFALVASDTEVEELLSKATEFQNMVEDWIRLHHSKFVAP